MINVLSLFDGLGGARLALDSLNIPCTYYASEIDPYAIKVAKWNYPDIIHLGDVREVGINSNLPDIDLLVGGSPCTDLSISKRNGKGLEGEASGLFYEYVRVMNEIKPRYFLLENVASMKQKDRDKITEIMGVKPVMINSSLVTAQQRKRLYWTNIEGIIQPVDRKIYLRDILEYGYTERVKAYCFTASYEYSCCKDYFVSGQRQLIFNAPVRIGTIGKGGQGERIYHVGGKSITLSANSGGGGGKTGLYEMKDYIRKLTPLEAKRLQGIPDDFTNVPGISNTQRYKMIGNGFTIPVISHILSYMGKVADKVQLSLF